MPTYEYACPECGHNWEEIQKISEAPVEICPACKKSAAKRLISGGNFILKGGGWYADLYSSPKGGGAAKTDVPAKESSGSPSAPSTGDAKTETKPEKSEKKDGGGGSKDGGSSSSGSSGSAAAA